MSAAAVEPVPRVGLRDAALGLQRHFRPGAHRGPLRRLGERCMIDVPGVPTLLVTSSPYDAKEILTNRDGALSLGRALHRTTPHPVLFGGDSLIFLEGDEHVRERRRLAPPFHGQMMRSFEPTIAAIARRHVESWPTGKPLEFVEVAGEFVLDVMRSVIFGVVDDRLATTQRRSRSASCRSAARACCRRRSSRTVRTGRSDRW